MCNCIVSVLLDVCIPMIFNHIRQTDQQVSLPLEHQFIINRYDTTNSQKLIYSWIYQDLFLQLKLQKYIISKRIYHLFFFLFCFVSYFGKVLSVCKSISYNSPRNQKVGLYTGFHNFFFTKVWEENLVYGGYITTLFLKMYIRRI